MRRHVFCTTLFLVAASSLVACSAAPEGAVSQEGEAIASPIETTSPISIVPTCTAGEVVSCVTTNNGIISVPHCFCVPGFYTVYSPTGAATPSSTMLDELGKVSMTIHNQGTNGGCWGFGDVAVVESEYVSELGYPAASFALSDQYNIFNAIKGYWGESDFYTSASTPIASFEMIGHYGLPPLSVYPDNLQGPWNVIPKVVGPIYSAENPQAYPSALSTFAKTGIVDPNWSSAIGTFIGQSPFANDMTRFNAASLAPQSVHEQAIYAPTSAEWVDFSTKYATGGANNCLDPNAAGDTSINCLNAFPFEEVLNQNHTIRVGMASDPDNWLQNPTTGVFGYKPNGGNDGHVVAIVGYDRARQVFRFKNSWGATWNGNGFGEMTYYLLMKIIAWQSSLNGDHQGSFVTGVRNPNATSTQTGGGAWMGFWNATIGGQKGVASLHYTFPYSIAVNNGAAPVVDVFQASSGATQQLDTIAGTATATSIAFSGTPTSPEYAVAAPFTLTRALGANTATYTNTSTGETETWYKCNPNTNGYAVAPTGYAAATNDPYVLPPCGDTSWEAAPVLSCNGSDVPVQGAWVQYASSPTAPVSWESGNYCFGVSSSTPQCPAGQQLNLDSGDGYYGAGAPAGVADEDVCTLDGQATQSYNSTLPQSCNAAPVSVLGASQYVEYAINANQSEVVNQQTVLQVGQDHCLSSIYQGTFACPGRSVMESNGDCFAPELVLGHIGL
jgi:hypothetical protein